MRLIYLSGSWLLGIYLGSRVDSSLSILLVALLSLLLLVPLWLRNFDRKGKILSLFCLALFLGGFFRFQQTLAVVNEHTLRFYNGQGTVEVEGIVEELPPVDTETTSLRLSAQQVKLDGEEKDVSGDMLVQTRSFPSYHYGDRLRIKGELQNPQNLGDFDYQGYLAQQGIYSLVLYPRIELIERGRGSQLKGWLFDLRGRLSQSLASALPEPQGSLAQALLLGIRSRLPDSLDEAFRATGTAHILAISGLHVTMLMGIFLSLGAWLWGRHRPTYLLLASGAIWLYALLSGMSPPTLRAAIMGSFFLVGQGIGRPNSAFASLVFAAALMAGIEPSVLWEISFQLSFLAMTGLLLFAPPFRVWGKDRIAKVAGKWSNLISPANVVVDNFAISLGAVITTLPLIAYNFHRIPLVSLPATWVVLLALPGTIVSSMLVGIIGLFSLPLSQIAGWADWFFLSWMIKTVEGFASLPFAFVPVSSLNKGIVWAFYASLFLSLWLIHFRKPWVILLRLCRGLRQAVKGRVIPLIYRLPGKFALGFLLTVTVLVWVVALTLPGSRFEVTFLDVGQGDAILIQTPSRQQILIDGGPDVEAISLQLGQKLPFWDRSLSLVVLTHPHEDHLTGLVEVVRRYKVEQVLKPALDTGSPVYQEWADIIRAKGIKYIRAEAGQQIELGGGAVLQVLHPQTELLEGTSSDIDNNGVVLRLVIGQVSFLLTGDIGEEAERELLHRGEELKSTVLKVAHHGSQTSTSEQFLAAIDPEAAVISVGKDNLFGHPDEEVLDRLKEGVSSDHIYRTSQQGTITFTTDGKKLWVKTEK